MEARVGIICPLVALAFISLVASATPPVVQVNIDLPASSLQVRINCKVGGTLKSIERIFNAGKHYFDFKAEEKAKYYCVATWGIRNFASFPGFDPKRDSGHGSVFWLVNPDGFYFGYDKLKLKKVADWETD